MSRSIRDLVCVLICGSVVSSLIAFLVYVPFGFLCRVHFHIAYVLLRVPLWMFVPRSLCVLNCALNLKFSCEFSVRVLSV